MSTLEEFTQWSYDCKNKVIYVTQAGRQEDLNEEKIINLILVNFPSITRNNIRIYKGLVLQLSFYYEYLPTDEIPNSTFIFNFER